MPKSIVQLEHADVLEQNKLAEAARLRQYAEQEVVRRLVNNVGSHSTEEQRLVLAMQSRLAELGNIIQRRMRGLPSPQDGERWSAIVTDLLQLGQKTGESSWSFVNLLPKNLPGIAVGVGLKKYRSRVKQHIRIYLTDHPNATAADILGYFDEQGIEGPSSWKENGTRELTVAYRKEGKIRNLIDSTVSKVRADMNL